MYVLTSGAGSSTMGVVSLSVYRSLGLTDWLLNCCWSSPAQWLLVPSPQNSRSYLTLWRLWEPSEHCPTLILTTRLRNQLLRTRRTGWYVETYPWREGRNGYLQGLPSQTTPLFIRKNEKWPSSHFNILAAGGSDNCRFLPQVPFPPAMNITLLERTACIRDSVRCPCLPYHGSASSPSPLDINGYRAHSDTEDEPLWRLAVKEEKWFVMVECKPKFSLSKVQLIYR
jgi:hypothetical protein